MTIVLGWWMMPTLITLALLFWAVFIVDGGSGMFSGLDNLIALAPACGISMIAWIIYAVFK